MDVVATFTAWSTMPLYKDMVFQHFNENTNVVFFNLALISLLVKLFYMPSKCILYLSVINHDITTSYHVNLCIYDYV